MKVAVITGSRKLSPDEELVGIFSRGVEFVITGDADGVDRAAYKIAKKMKIRVVACKAWWKDYDKAAGPLRNGDMVQLALTLKAAGHEVYAHAFPDVDSVGTHNCAMQLAAAGIDGVMYGVPVLIHSYATAKITGMKA